jgi:hypothetical protein
MAIGFPIAIMSVSESLELNGDHREALGYDRISGFGQFGMED